MWKPFPVPRADDLQVAQAHGASDESHLAATLPVEFDALLEEESQSALRRCPD
jgi:hypothetical protein